MTNSDVFCETCGSRQFLKHAESCSAWRIAVIPPGDTPAPETRVQEQAS